jgi:hypothetical protein
MTYPLRTRPAFDLGQPPRTSRDMDSTEDPPSSTLDAKDQASADSCGCGDSREHVGWVLYPRVRVSRRRAFRGARPSLQDRVVTGEDAKSVTATPAEPQPPVQEPSLNTQTKGQASSGSADPA